MNNSGTILIRSATIADHHSSFNGKQVDVYIRNGMIEDIGPGLSPEGSPRILEFEDLQLSPGWCDIGSYCGEPGDEVHETIESLSAAARNGGYTHVALFSNPVRPFDNRHIISDITAGGKYGVRIIPIGSISKGLEGKELAEMLDIASVTSAIFTDGFYRSFDNSMLSKALEYSLQCNGCILSIPGMTRRLKYGQVNESKISAQMGIPGIPGFEEIARLASELSLASYSGSTYFAHLLSHAESVNQVKFRKELGLNVYASVSAMHLLHTEEAVSDFDENFKILPPLRGEADRLALQNGLREGTIDMVSANHRPVISEQKQREFGESPFGAIGLETCYLSIATSIKNLTSMDVHKWLSKNPRHILQLSQATIEKGATPDLTLFSLSGNTTYDAQKSRSASKNSPYSNHSFTGQVFGTIVGNQLYLTA